MSCSQYSLINNIIRSFAITLIAAVSCFAQETATKNGDAVQKSRLLPGKRIIFLGDSNTFSGEFISYLEAAAMKNTDSTNWDLLNLGVPSETASGLSEPKHPFPRPCVHERLDRTLEKTQPDIVVACYGMNDAIYYPFSQTNFEAYTKGMQQLVEKVAAADAQLILLTPPPFENAAVRKFGPHQDGGYSWMQPSNDYDDVMRTYSDKLIELFGDQHSVLDTHSSITKWASENLQTEERLTRDGVHFAKVAHKALAQWLYKELVDADIESVQLQDEVWEIATKRMAVRRNAWLQHCGWNRPKMPKGLSIDEAEKQAGELKAQICK